VSTTTTSGKGTGRLTYSAGTVDANDVIRGEASGAAASDTGIGHGTLEVLGSGQLVVNNNITLGKQTATPVAGVPIGTLAIAGTGSGFASFTLQKLPARMTAHLSDNAGNTSVDLVVDAYDTPKWTGLNNGITPNNNWNINTTNSWKLVNAGTPTTYQEDL